VKKAGTKVLVPAVSWLVCPDKLRRRAGVNEVGARSRNAEPRFLRRKIPICLRGSSGPQRQIPHLRQDARHLHSVQLRNEWQNLSNELIFHQVADFVLAALFTATEQFRHGHLQGSSQSLQRRQRGRGFFVFDFGNIGSRHGHASSQLPLAQPAAQAKRADGGREVEVPTAHTGHWHHYWRRHHHRFGLGFLVQGRVAAPAIVIDRTELNQQAVIATDDFPRVYWGKSRGHRVVGVPEPATPWNLKIGGRFRPQRQSAVQGLWKSRLKCIEPRVLPAKTGSTRLNPAIDKARAMIDRESAWCLLTEFTQSESLRKHALAVEACMRACSRKFADRDHAPDGRNDREGHEFTRAANPPSSSAASAPEGMSEEELWGIVGLIHDFDYEKYPSLEDHPYKGNEILKERGWPEVIRRAIMSHAEYTGVTRDTPMEKALFACDELAGFITAVALIKPGKSLAEVDAKSVRKRMKDKAFARKVNRDDIVNGAAALGVDLDEHISFCIAALQGVAGQLGLDGSAAKTF
jgi:predicted hydrolase (HD superfamily)